MKNHKNPPGTMNSAQRVPEPDPLPGISFDTRPDPIQFWKSLGSGLPDTSGITRYFG